MTEDFSCVGLGHMYGIFPVLAELQKTHPEAWSRVIIDGKTKYLVLDDKMTVEVWTKAKEGTFTNRHSAAVYRLAERSKIFFHSWKRASGKTVSTAKISAKKHSQKLYVCVVNRAELKELKPGIVEAHLTCLARDVQFYETKSDAGKKSLKIGWKTKKPKTSDPFPRLRMTGKILRSEIKVNSLTGDRYGYFRVKSKGFLFDVMVAEKDFPDDITEKKYLSGVFTLTGYINPNPGHVDKKRFGNSLVLDFKKAMSVSKFENKIAPALQNLRGMRDDYLIVDYRKAKNFPVDFIQTAVSKVNVGTGEKRYLVEYGKVGYNNRRYLYRLKETDQPLTLEYITEVFRTVCVNGKEPLNWEWGDVSDSFIEQHACPVCGQYYFKRPYTFQLCPICGWVDYKDQEENPDEECGPNRGSLNQSRQMWKEERRFDDLHCVGMGDEYGSLCPIYKLWKTRPYAWSRIFSGKEIIHRILDDRMAVEVWFKDHPLCSYWDGYTIVYRSLQANRFFFDTWLPIDGKPGDIAGLRLDENSEKSLSVKIANAEQVRDVAKGNVVVNLTCLARSVQFWKEKPDVDAQKEGIQSLADTEEDAAAVSLIGRILGAESKVNSLTGGRYGYVQVESDGLVFAAMVPEKDFPDDIAEKTYISGEFSLTGYINPHPGYFDETRFGVPKKFIAQDVFSEEEFQEKIIPALKAMRGVVKDGTCVNCQKTKAIPVSFIRSMVVKLDDDGKFYYSVDYGVIDAEGNEHFLHSRNILPIEELIDIFRTVCVEGKEPSAWEWKEVEAPMK